MSRWCAYLKRYRAWLVVLAIGYVSLYATLRWQAVQRSHEYGVDCLMYIDVRGHGSWKVHQALAGLFWPLWGLERLFWKGPQPCSSEPLFELSARD